VGSGQWAVGSGQIGFFVDMKVSFASHRNVNSKILFSPQTLFVMGFRTLIGYQKAFKLAMDIFELSKSFPSEEKYSLTDQIRRASRSVCSNIAEGYRKRRYEKHFLSKLTDADSELEKRQK
jgi:hypothetical protein